MRRIDGHGKLAEPRVAKITVNNARHDIQPQGGFKKAHRYKKVKMLNYNCPNGLPPEECLHVPQLIINVLDFLSGRGSREKKAANLNDVQNDKARGNPPSSSRNACKRG